MQAELDLDQVPFLEQRAVDKGRRGLSRDWRARTKQDAVSSIKILRLISSERASERVESSRVGSDLSECREDARKQDKLARGAGSRRPKIVDVGVDVDVVGGTDRDSWRQAELLSFSKEWMGPRGAREWAVAPKRINGYN